MQLVHSRRTTRWLLAIGVALLLFWLALPRLLGFAADRWLAIPGLESLHVDVESVGAGHARLREMRAIYKSAGGHTLQIALHDIVVDYSPAAWHVDRVVVARGELAIFPAESPPDTPWPQLEWPHLPVSEALVSDLRVAVHRAERPPLEARGNFSLRQAEGQAQAELRLDAGLLRMNAREAKLPGNEFVIHVEWLPDAGPLADARLYINRQPAQHPARIVAQAPLPALAQLGRSFGIALPLTASRGTATLKAEALLGESAGTVRALSGEVEITDAGLQATRETNLLDIALAGKLHFAWQPLAAHVELQPGLLWQVALSGESSLQASGRLDRVFSLRRDNGNSLSDGSFPFALRSSQWGQWDGAVQRLRLEGGKGLADWNSADVQLRIAGQLKQWQRDAIRVSNLQAAGDVGLHLSQSGLVRSELAFQVGVGRFSWSGAYPIAVTKAAWTINAEAAAKADGDFWKSLVLHGEASSPRLNVVHVQRPSQTLTLGPSRLRLLQFHPAQREGELLLELDAVRVGTAPAPDLLARVRLDGNAVRTDGNLLLQGTEVLRFAGSHALSRGCGEAALTTQKALPTLGKLLQPRPRALLPLALELGEADARFTLDWCTQPTPRFDAKGTLKVRNATVGWERARANALQATVQLDGLHPVQGRIQLTAERGELATGTALAGLNVDLALAARRLTVHALQVKLLGGSVHSGPLSLPWPPSDQTLPLEIRQIDLGQLLALFDTQGLSGSGQLDGVLPLTYGEGSVGVRDGQLSSVGSGIIKYAPALSVPDNFGLQALRNFHFRQLDMRLGYANDGAYRTQAKLEGSNPDFYNGYPIRFSLNINGALPGLVRSALFSGDFNRHILEQLQSGKLE